MRSLGARIVRRTALGSGSNRLGRPRSSTDRARDDVDDDHVGAVLVAYPEIHSAIARSCSEASSPTTMLVMGLRASMCSCGPSKFPGVVGVFAGRTGEALERNYQLPLGVGWK